MKQSDTVKGVLNKRRAWAVYNAAVQSWSRLQLMIRADRSGQESVILGSPLNHAAIVWGMWGSLSIKLCITSDCKEPRWRELLHHTWFANFCSAMVRVPGQRIYRI